MFVSPATNSFSRANQQMGYHESGEWSFRENITVWFSQSGLTISIYFADGKEKLHQVPLLTLFYRLLVGDFP